MPTDRVHEFTTVTSINILDGFGSLSGNYSLRLEVEVMVGHLSLAKLQTPTSLLHLLPLSQPNWKENQGHFSAGIRLRSENFHLNSWINIDSCAAYFVVLEYFIAWKRVVWGHN